MFLVFKDWFQCFFLFSIYVCVPNVRCIFPILHIFFPSWIYVPNCNVSNVCFQYIWSRIPVWSWFGWGLVMFIGVVKGVVNRSYCWRYCFECSNCKWRNSDDHQSVEQKVELVDIEFLVCLLKPKIDHFSSFDPDTF